jgi:DNA-binding NtrC family response regulator/ligand-binding sensor domain-containing protein
MINFFKKYLFFCFYLICPLLTFSQTHDFNFDHITVDNGLSQNTPRAIIQDSKGFIWIGTQEGLNRYDGYNFKIYKYDANDETSISENSILAIFESKSNDIWIGTNGGGLNKFDRVREKFTRYRFNPNDPTSLSQDYVSVIYEDRLGNLWIGTYFGLNKFDSKTEKFTRYYIFPEIINHNSILSIFEDKRGQLWVGTEGGGLNRFNRKTEEWERYLYDTNNPNSISCNRVSAIYEDSFGKFWIGTMEGGLNQFDVAKDEFMHYKCNANNPNSVSSNSIYKIYEDKSGIVWIGTLGGGLCKYNRKTENFVRYENNIKNPNGLSNNQILSIMEDNSGLLWIGTGGGGINILNKFNPGFSHYKNNPYGFSGSNNNFVWAIEEDYTGALWIGTQGAGVYHVNRKTGNVEQYTHDPSDPASISHNIVYSIVEDRTGTIWIGTDGGGLNKFISKKSRTEPNGRFKRYIHDSSDPKGLASNYVRKIYEDSDGIIWLSVYRAGLQKFNPKTGEFTHYSPGINNTNGVSSSHVFDIIEDSSGKIWIGTWGGGLQKYNKKSNIFLTFTHNPNNKNSLSHNRVGTIFEDDSGFLWIGTDNGLDKLDKSTGIFKRYSTENGLPNNVIYGILSDDYGNLWISTNKGLFRLNPETGKIKNYDVNDGLQSNEFNTGACLKTRQGELIFGGINGINIFIPENVRDNSHIPPIVVTGIKRFNKEVKFENAISEIKQLEFSYNENSFSFEFAALDYNNPNKNQYAFTLEGYDKDWIYSGNDRIASYTKVPPGNYIFKVKGSNNDDIWNNEGTEIEIIIIPPFWQTWWFKFIIFMSLSVTVYSFYRKRINKIEAKKKVLQDRVEERTEAAENLQNALDKVEQLKKQLEAENIYLQDEIKLVHNFEAIITQNDALKKLLHRVEKVASTDATVLILGESGTGKELLARAVHNISNRKKRPLVKVNCSVLPANLIESELFGHEKGAFTGAISRKIGRFELANGGTIFLDEIGDLPMDLQSKLLRILQEGEFERLGNPVTIKVDVRVISATNRNIEKGIEQGTFREDLFYRLNVFPITIPPLRDRKNDIPLLVKHFVDKYGKKTGSKIDIIPENVMSTLTTYHWPGNVRELENIIERAIILNPGQKLVLGDWFSKINLNNENHESLSLEDNERQLILKALEETDWRVSGDKGAAIILGLKPTTLEYRMKKLGINRNHK